MNDLVYVLPLRWEDDADLAGLTGYLRRLRRAVPVIVVDGSPAELFARHARAWRGLVAHLRPDPGLACGNGKVGGVITGVRHATAEYVVIADDDVRYDAAALARMRALLATADLVRPQNHFDPLPWHARWDTARSLLNRCLGGDYPGTLGVRRSTFLAMGGYDGDTLFENLELIRTVRAHGGRVRHAPGLYVRRLPPSPGRFLDQRVRQAYDDFAQPPRLAAFLAVLPALAAGLLRNRRRTLLAGAAAAAVSIGAAEVGRRRAGGRRVFPAGTVLFAPVWLLERAVCSWLAVAARLRGGVPYRGKRLKVAAHSVRELRRQRAASSGAAVAGAGVSGAAMSGAVAPEAAVPEAASAGDAVPGTVPAGDAVSGSAVSGDAVSETVPAGDAVSGPAVSGDPVPGTVSAGDAVPGARKPVTLWEPSQNGLTAERPQRHSATVARPGSMTRPS